MAITTQQVMDYIDTHPLLYQSGDFTSFLDMLHSVYVESNPIDTDKLRHGFSQIRHILNQLPPDAADLLFNLVCDQCLEYEQTAFAHGILVGLYLHTELSTLC